MLASKQSIGALDKRITFQEKIFTIDIDSNQKRIDGWQDILTTPTVYAQVDEQAGNEVIQADELTGIKVNTFIVRYRNDITIEHRIIYNDGKFDIHSISEVGRKRFLRISAESGGQYTEIIS